MLAWSAAVPEAPMPKALSVSMIAALPAELKVSARACGFFVPRGANVVDVLAEHTPSLPAEGPTKSIQKGFQPFLLASQVRARSHFTYVEAPGAYRSDRPAVRHFCRPRGGSPTCARQRRADAKTAVGRAADALRSNAHRRARRGVRAGRSRDRRRARAAPPG